MRFRNLQGWLDWLEQCHPQEIDLGLSRVRQVAERLSLTTAEARIITVAGTNGKGSCVAATAALLRQAGHRVGVYTSPHLLDYRERIVVDGQSMADTDICEAFAAIDQARGPVSLTYFEFGTLAALWLFRRARVDFAVLEVGLGGRLDAVNVVDPDIAVVTSVDLDHQEWLGNDRDSIGREKAGIFRRERPALCADPEPPASLLAVARGLDAPLFALGGEFGFSLEDGRWCWWGRGADGSALSFTRQPLPRLPLPSMAAALQAVALAGMALDAGSFQVLAELTLAGRWQHLDLESRDLLLDVAHNPAAGAYLSRRLTDEPAGGRTLAVVAMLADKDHEGTLKPLLPLVQRWYPGELAAVSRALPAADLQRILQSCGAEVAACGTVAQMLEQALAESVPGDRILVFGSFYTVSAALQWWRARAPGTGVEP